MAKRHGVKNSGRGSSKGKVSYGVIQIKEAFPEYTYNSKTRQWTSPEGKTISRRQMENMYLQYRLNIESLSKLYSKPTQGKKVLFFITQAKEPVSPTSYISFKKSSRFKKATIKKLKEMVIDAMPAGGSRSAVEVLEEGQSEYFYTPTIEVKDNIKRKEIFYALLFAIQYVFGKRDWEEFVIETCDLLASDEVATNEETHIFFRDLKYEWLRKNVESEE